ncbi:MAG: hypothetical protein G8345_03110 [Magnetococcales bacterium]|nr:hypothetical protein [Magnetococcales bacterium]NGZ25862.1 hypothetical protein [Magnetococcales bacterium]
MNRWFGMVWGGLVLVNLTGWSQAAPPPGHPGVEQTSGILAIPPASLTLRGKVLESMDSNDYTYLRVSHESDGERWLAAPRVSLKVGEMVRYGEGTRMVNFYSKVWNRTFPVVYFIREVQRDE